jgi:hypothetical protein
MTDSIGSISPRNPKNPTDMSDAELEQMVREFEAKWEKAHPKIEQLFMQVLTSGVPVEKLARSGQYPRETERWFEKKLERLLYVPKLPSGGPDEKRQAFRLSKVAGRLKTDEEGRFPKGAKTWLWMLANKYRELPGCYYIFKLPPDAVKAGWLKAKEDAAEREDAEARFICDTVLKGIPEPISDFVVEPLFVLVEVNGTRCRVVRIRNIHGEVSEPLRWPSEQFSAPKAMRIWLNDNANCANWAAGERELQHLGMDIGQALAGKEVREVVIRGYHYDSGLTFFEDCAITPCAKRLRQDSNGVFWWQGKGYLMSEKDQEGDPYRMGPNEKVDGPMMHPTVVDNAGELRDIFRQMAKDMHDALGGYEAWLAMGAVLAQGAAKAIFERYTALPTLWVCGEQGHGKSSFVRWLMRIWGYSVKAGVQLPGTTQAALRGALQQYADLLVWLDEYQPSCEAWVTELLKGMYDRGGSIKKTFGEMARAIRSSVVVTGVATPSDGQLRSRCLYVQVAREKRINYSEERFREMDMVRSLQFYRLGRFIIEHREEFSELVLGQIDVWVKDAKLRDVEERTRILHGAAYGAFAALSWMLESHTAQELHEFKLFLRGYVEVAQKDVKDQLFVSLFFEDVLSAAKAGFFGETPSEMRRYFKVKDKESEADAAVSAYQREKGQLDPYCAWKGKLLYIASKDCVEQVMGYRRSIGKPATLSKKDLHDQMKGRPFFVEPPAARRTHTIRFEGGGQETAWCIDVDKIDIGLVPVSDEDFDASLRKADGNFIERVEWQDPRKGALFTLIDQLTPKQQEAR